ncbi:hypothetical protein [Silicimonas sp. MF1-12-2]|uniref:hypothetical protein n=1 Tax=Silicimonas sp. MF1-12-2 TaxID=3384793 RepID=UPI0039B375A8
MARLIMTGLVPGALTETNAVRQIAAMPFCIAHRIAANWSIAGIHFPMDSATSAVLGCALGGSLLMTKYSSEGALRQLQRVGANERLRPAFFADSPDADFV